jgi:tRNA U34 5-methylaminomethyl-2-thiouridine-forming methyltransferase MnmC
MIDQEQLIFDEVSKALREKFDDVFITGVEIVSSPPQFPAVSIVQKTSGVNKKYSTFEKVQNVAEEEYEFNIYSNLVSEKEAKQQTKDIVAVIDGVMSNLFYIRSFNQQIPSADTKNTRRVARYKNANVT